MKHAKLLVSISALIAAMAQIGPASAQSSLEFSGKLDLDDSAPVYQGSLTSDGRIRAEGVGAAKCSGSTKIETTPEGTKFRHGEMLCTAKNGTRVFEIRTVGLPAPGGFLFAFEDGVGYRLDLKQ